MDYLSDGSHLVGQLAQLIIRQSSRRRWGRRSCRTTRDGVVVEAVGRGVVESALVAPRRPLSTPLLVRRVPRGRDQPATPQGTMVRYSREPQNDVKCTLCCGFSLCRSCCQRQWRHRRGDGGGDPPAVELPVVVRPCGPAYVAAEGLVLLRTHLGAPCPRPVGCAVTRMAAVHPLGGAVAGAMRRFLAAGGCHHHSVRQLPVAVIV